jgi:hypothetical protein
MNGVCNKLCALLGKEGITRKFAGSPITESFFHFGLPPQK